MTPRGSEEAPTVASGRGFQEHQRNQQHDCHSAPDAEQAQQSIDGARKAVERLRAAAACQGIAVNEMACGEVQVCEWGLTRAVPVDALAAFLEPMEVYRA